MEGVAEASTTVAGFDSRPHHRHVAGVIGDAFILLVGRLMLLIDDDQAQVGEGQEQRRPGAGHHAHVAFRRAAPDPRAAARRQAGMPFRRAVAEARGESVEKLRRERDFRHQDQSLATLAQSLGDRLEIDLGLAGAGHAFKQDGLERFRRDGFAQGLRRFRLIWRKERRGKIGIGLFGRFFRRQGERLQRAFVDQAVDDADRDPGLAGQFGLAEGQTTFRRLQHPFARRRLGVSARRR